jgi:hypothetical protein
LRKNCFFNEVKKIVHLILKKPSLKIIIDYFNSFAVQY